MEIHFIFDTPFDKEVCGCIACSNLLLLCRIIYLSSVLVAYVLRAEYEKTQKNLLGFFSFVGLRQSR